MAESKRRFSIADMILFRGKLLESRSCQTDDGFKKETKTHKYENFRFLIKVVSSLLLFLTVPCLDAWKKMNQ